MHLHQCFSSWPASPRTELVPRARAPEPRARAQRARARVKDVELNKAIADSTKFQIKNPPMWVIGVGAVGLLVAVVVTYLCMALLAGDSKKSDNSHLCSAKTTEFQTSSNDRQQLLERRMREALEKKRAAFLASSTSSKSKKDE